MQSIIPVQYHHIYHVNFLLSEFRSMENVVEFSYCLSAIMHVVTIFESTIILFQLSAFIVSLELARSNSKIEGEGIMFFLGHSYSCG